MDDDGADVVCFSSDEDAMPKAWEESQGGEDKDKDEDEDEDKAAAVERGHEDGDDEAAGAPSQRQSRRTRRKRPRRSGAGEKPMRSVTCLPEYQRVKAAMTSEPYASLKGRALFQFANSLDILKTQEPDPADVAMCGTPQQRKRLWQKWWRNFADTFAFDVARVQNLDPAKTMDRAAAMLVLITRAKPSVVDTILLNVAAGSVGDLDRVPDDPAARAAIIAQYQCRWE